MRGRPFKPGESGNPAGKPKGAKNRSTLLREQIEKFGPELIRIIKKAARGGEDVPPDMSAALALLARLDPPLRSRGTTVQIELDETAPLSTQCEQVIRSIANGSLSVEEGKQIIDALRLLAETRVLENRGGDDAQALVDSFKQISQVIAASDRLPYHPPAAGPSSSAEPPQAPPAPTR